MSSKVSPTNDSALKYRRSLLSRMQGPPIIAKAHFTFSLDQLFITP
jgi:hypothetical protein